MLKGKGIKIFRSRWGSAEDVWDCETIEKQSWQFVRGGAHGVPHLPIVPSLRLSLLLGLEAEAVHYLGLDRAELCRAESCSLFPSPLSFSLRPQVRDTFQVSPADGFACEQLAGAERARSWTRAGYAVIKRTATGRSWQEKKVKTYWIVVQRASEQTTTSGISAAFQRVESTKRSWAAGFAEGSHINEDL